MSPTTQAPPGTGAGSANVSASAGPPLADTRCHLGKKA